MPLYGPCSWNILVHRCFEASDSGSRNRDFIVLFTQKTWLCSKSESEVTGADGEGEHLIAVGTAVSSRPPHRSVREYTNSYGSSFRSGVKPDVWPRVDGSTWGREHLGTGALGDTHKPEPISPSLTPSDFDAVYLWDVFSFFGKTI